MKKLLYLQISDEILNQIVSGDLKPGTQVMSVRELALKKQVNPKTIQKAFEYLENLEAFYVIKGEGRYVTNDISVINVLKENIIEKEIHNFVNKAKEYDLDLEQILMKIKEIYEQ